MTIKEKQLALSDMIRQVEDNENDFPVVDDLSKVKKGFRGIVMVINDHGNITVYRHFKNGSAHEIASRV